MYDVTKLEAWKQKVQAQIDAVIEANLEDLGAIIKSEIKPTDRLTSAMGMATLMNSKGQSYLFDVPCSDDCRNFIQALTDMQYPKYFQCETTLFKDIRWPIKKRSNE